MRRNVAKVRVYELAKELGVESKILLKHLKEHGEFVRSASSTIEPPVVRKIRETFPAEMAAAGGPAAGAKASAASTAKKPVVKPDVAAAAAVTAPAAPVAPSVEAPVAPVVAPPEVPTRPGAPTPGPKPASR